MPTVISATCFPTARAKPAACAIASTRRPCASSRWPIWKARATLDTCPCSTTRTTSHDHPTRPACRRLLLGHAGAAAQAARRARHPRRLLRRQRGERHLSQPRGPRRNRGNHLRFRCRRLPAPAGAVLPDPRPDHREPPGQRHRHQLPLGHLLSGRRAEARRRRHHRRRRGLGPVARQGRHRSRPGRRFLGGRTGTPGLSAALSRGLQLSFRAGRLGVAEAVDGLRLSQGLVMTDRLIACVLGGAAPGARTELHDVAFAVGPDLEAVHEQLLDGWFGDPHGLHVDAWAFLDSVEGYRVRLARTPPANGLRLYFINIGGYRPGEFGEQHAWGFFGGSGAGEVQARAKQRLLEGRTEIHKDTLHAVDDCLPVERIHGWHIHLEPDTAAGPPVVTNGYAPLPAATVKAWTARRDKA